MKQKKSISLRCLCEGAVLIALAQILGYLKLFHMPNGGSVTLNMLPIFLFCARWGFGPGMLASFAFSLLQLFLDTAYSWGWQSILGDYIIAYSVLGMAGLFRGRRYGFFWGTLLGGVLRYLSSYLTGAAFWRSTGAVMGVDTASPWIFSALYNVTILISVVLALVIGALMMKPLGKYMRGEDIRRA